MATAHFCALNAILRSVSNCQHDAGQAGAHRYTVIYPHGPTCISLESTDTIDYSKMIIKRDLFSINVYILYNVIVSSSS